MTTHEVDEFTEPTVDTHDHSLQQTEPLPEADLPPVPAEASTAEPPTAEPSPAAGSSTGKALFADHELNGLQERWAKVQAAFVDDPKDSVHQADGLVSDVVEQITSNFSQARSHLEEQWARGEEASTEDLRVALTHYREFFQRLLTV